MEVTYSVSACVSDWDREQQKGASKLGEDHRWLSANEERKWGTDKKNKGQIIEFQ